MGTSVTGHRPCRSTCDTRHGWQNTYPDRVTMAGCVHARAHSGHGASPPSAPPRVGLSRTPGGCRIAYVCDQNSTHGLHALPGGVGLVTCATRTRLMGCTHSRGVSDWLRVRPELDLWVARTPGGCRIAYVCDQNSTYGLHALPGGVGLLTWTTLAVIN
jgi:hypothetical protein